MNILLVTALLISTTIRNPPEQHYRVLTAKYHATQSLGEAMERVYSLESDSVERFPPSTLDQIYIAALSWRILTGEEIIPAARKGRSTRHKAPLSISIGSIDGNDQRAVVLVTKEFDGTYKRTWNRASRVRSTATFRHTWMNSGSKWLLMTSVPVKASMSIDGKAFTPDRKYFDPDTSFRAATPFDPTGRRDGIPPP